MQIIHTIVHTLIAIVIVVALLTFLESLTSFLKEVKDIAQYGLIVEERGNTTIYKPNF